MKVKSITLDDDEDPATVTVEMTIDEAAYIARFTGSISPMAIVAGMSDRKWADVSSAIYDCMAGSLFNRFWDDGVDDVVPTWRDLNNRLLKETQS